jgi:DNA-binding NtrC family response regulator
MPQQLCEAVSPPGRDSSPAGLAVPCQRPGCKPGVLVVDDEQMVRDLLQVALGPRGFEVWVAAGGAEALEVYQRHRNDIALVLLDVRMPGLDGPQTLCALQQVDPAVRCCFMSGDLDGYEPADLLKRGALLLFPKPFRLLEVIGILRQLVDSVP